MPKAFYFEEPLEANHWPEILDEIYIKRIYAPFVTDAKDKLCLDIGGNLGLTSYYFAQHFKQVYAYEPSKAHFDNFTRMLNTNGIKNVTLVKEAVANTTGKMTLNLCANTTMNSLINIPGFVNGSEEVDVVTIEDVFKNNKIEKLHFLKLDPEGSEGEIIMGKPFQNVVDKIDNIVYEYHNWCPANPNLINNTLKDYGFKVTQLPTTALVFAAER